MAAPTETYVDPAIAGASGAGTIGDPYGDLQHALDTMTRDATNGDRINILAGTDEIMGAAIDLTTYGTPTADAPIIFQGYTSAAGDGGIGGISGGGTVSVYNNTTIDDVHFIDLHLHNTGSNVIISTDDRCSLINCELDNSTANPSVQLQQYALVINCEMHNFRGHRQSSGFCAFNTIHNIVSNSDGILSFSSGLTILHNVIDHTGSGNGINMGHDAVSVIGNSVYSNGGTGTGILVGGASENGAVLNNIIEGYSGVGGIGLEIAAGADVGLIGYNAFYNNATNESITGDVKLDLGNDQALGASPFTNAGADDFTVDTSVRALAYPTANYPSLGVRSYLDIGALQRQEAGGAAADGALLGGRLVR